MKGLGLDRALTSNAEVASIPDSSGSVTYGTQQTPAFGLIAALAGTKLVIHLVLGGRYGYFRDELYFLDCGRHLDWGYVDHAPMIGLVARIALLLGASLHALRIFPAVAGALLIVLTMLIAWQLGGDRFAQGLAGLSVLVAPEYLAGNSILSMNCFEPLFWMGCVYVLIRIIQTGDSRRWIWFGVLAGLGLMNKHSTAFFGLAVVIGLLLTEERTEFLKPWIWVAGAIAFAIFSPNLIWQVRRNFPTLEDLHNVAVSGKNVVLGPGAFIKQQIMMMHPILFPVWLAGLGFFLLGRGARYRALGWIYLVLLVTFIVLHGKDYYLAPAYPMLLAGGAVAIDGWLDRGRVTRGKAWPKAAVAMVIAIAGAITAPLVLPLLPPEKYGAYERFLHIVPAKTEVNHDGPLPQEWGDQFGWQELVEQVAGFYNSLPMEERAKTAILTGNYGEAGAIDLFGPKYGLPTALSGHQTHYFWGTMGFMGDNLIATQYGPKHLHEMCNSVEAVGFHSHPWGMEEENQTIYFCRGLKQPLSQIWEDQKHWN